VCRRAAPLRPTSAAEAQAFYEENFTPVAIARIGESKGLLTGYFEPVVEGSRFPSPEFNTPLYRRPRDLLVDGRPIGKGDIPNRAVINRRNAQNELVPYYDRAAIENGALDGQHLEICWLRDPFEALSIQIEGSARVRLEDGTMLRVNYDGHNGHRYAAVGRILIEQYGIPPEQMSMERIRQWMLANPELAAKVRQANASFVFFRITGLSDEGEAVGAQGVPLSPGRSIAVDKLHVYGTPFFIKADLPIDSDKANTKFRRLMIAQDTGYAINGPARADLYWGAGDTAGRIAGRIRQQGQFVMLLPRELDMVEAGKHMPLPPPKPPIPAAAQAKNDTGKTIAEDVRPIRRSHQPPEPLSRRQAHIRSRTGT
jgi:membrane-bound lytic murein transglycosylase A